MWHRHFSQNLTYVSFWSFTCRRKAKAYKNLFSVLSFAVLAQPINLYLNSHQGKFFKNIFSVRFVKEKSLLPNKQWKTCIIHNIWTKSNVWNIRVRHQRSTNLQHTWLTMRHFSWMALVTNSTNPVALVAQNALGSSDSLRINNNSNGVANVSHKTTLRFACLARIIVN